MPFDDDIRDRELGELDVRSCEALAIELRGHDEALLRTLSLRLGLTPAEVVRVALLGLSAPRRFSVRSGPR